MNSPIITLLYVLNLTLFLNPEVQAVQKPKHIVLLGASVGKAWNIESLLDRLMKNPLTPDALRLTTFPYRFEYVGEYQFDKTQTLQEILKRKENKPNAIFIKECSAYFPGDLPKYQDLMKGWVTQCKQAGVIPIPTTVVPVIRDDSLKARVKDLVKKVIGKSPSTLRLTQLLDYNDWIKSYGQKEGLVILDLEAPLRTSNEDRSLRIDLHSGDGLHLNEKAYSFLDKIVLPTLKKCF